MDLRFLIIGVIAILVSRGGRKKLIGKERESGQWAEVFNGIGVICILLFVVSIFYY